MDLEQYKKQHKEKFGSDYILCHTVTSNGSKFFGEEHDTIEKLIVVLNNYTIEEFFFTKYICNRDEEGPIIYKNMCPIDFLPNGNVHFFGNFEKISHVFNIETNNIEIIEKLYTAIKKNKGWELYYEKHLIKTGQISLF